MELTDSNTGNLAVYKHAMDLNEILARDSGNPTMYDAFSFIANNQSKTIKTVISAIDTAEGSSSLKIVWDQTIDRFSVVKDNGGTTVEVLYTMKGKNGLNGTLNGWEQAYPLWDVFDENHSIPETNGTNYKIAYSVYWNGENLPSANFMNSVYIKGGFDIGVLDSSTTLNLNIGGVDYEVENRPLFIVRTKSNVNLTYQSNFGLKHIGELQKLLIGVSPAGWEGYHYYEYGTVAFIEKIVNYYTADMYTIHAMPGSYFGQSKASIEALGCTVVDAGGTFGTN